MKLLRPFIPLLVLAFVLGVVLTAVKKPQELRRKAAPASTVSLTPAAPSVQRGATLTLDVMVDTGENLISAADLVVTFDKDKLKAQSIAGGDFLANVLVAGSVTDTQAKITLGSPPTSPHKGKGKLALIIFQAKGEGSTQVRIDDATQIAGIGEAGNVVVGKIPATVTISGGGGGSQPTPTPTSRPSVRPTVTRPSVVGPPGTIQTPLPSAPQSPCQNACGNGACEKDCGESAFTCSVDCKASSSTGSDISLPPRESKPASEPLFAELIRKFLQFFGIRL
ncbi:hypothetical protein HY086_00995 [Candidatus Gottesmanbacteria bacterium]|nr:hypothetical protein [Candidatus Gottesmanbacteria bacterium]